jgi:hypothetical protein
MLALAFEVFIIKGKENAQYDKHDALLRPLFQ